MSVQAQSISVGTLCWWCLHPPDVASSLRTMSELCRDMHGKKCVGAFCSFECCLAFMTRWQFDEHSISALMASFQQLMHEVHANRCTMILKKAADPFVLHFPYGGPLSIEDFRASFYTITNIPLQDATLPFTHYVETMMQPYYEKRIYLERIMKSNTDQT